MKQFQVVYADPPWLYSFQPAKHKLPYPSMPTEDLCSMGEWVRSLCTKDCVLYMWATSPKLSDALLVLEAWGFKLKTTMVWDKERPYVGSYHNSKHELLLIGGRGRSAPRIDRKGVIAVNSVLHEHKTTHSRKPEQVYRLIDLLYPRLLKLELFARKPKVRRFWSYWGDQAGKRQVLKSKPTIGEFRGFGPVPGLTGVVSTQRYGKLIRTTILADGTKYDEIPEPSSKARKPRRPSLPIRRRNVLDKGPRRFLSRLKARLWRAIKRPGSGQRGSSR